MTPKHILMHNTRTKHQKEEQSRPREQVFTIKSECLASSTFLGSYSSLRQEKKKKEIARPQACTAGVVQHRRTHSHTQGGRRCIRRGQSSQPPPQKCRVHVTGSRSASRTPQRTPLRPSAPSVNQSMWRYLCEDICDKPSTAYWHLRQW